MMKLISLKKKKRKRKITAQGPSFAGSRSGYRAEIHWEVEADTKKQERLHMAMATGVLWVKLDKDSSTQSRTMEDWPVAWSVWNTWEHRSRWMGLELAPSSPL